MFVIFIHIQTSKASISNRNRELNEMKTELVCLEKRMNHFNVKYNKQKLSEIFDTDNDDDMDKDKQNDKAISKTVMNRYCIDYESWDINTIIAWIRGLENQRFDKYSDKLRNGFHKFGLKRGSELVYITERYLHEEPFNINIISDCKDLAEHFKALKHRKTMHHTEGMQYQLS